MELTADNQDEMDCRPLGRETGIKIPETIQAEIDRRAALKTSGKLSKPSPAKPTAE